MVALNLANFLISIVQKPSHNFYLHKKSSNKMDTQKVLKSHQNCYNLINNIGIRKNVDKSDMPQYAQHKELI